MALLVQGVGSAAFIVMSQAGTGVRGAYDALVGITVIAYFIPFLLMFAALIKLQRAPAGPDVIRAPGGPPSRDRGGGGSALIDDRRRDGDRAAAAAGEKHLRARRRQGRRRELCAAAGGSGAVRARERSPARAR